MLIFHKLTCTVSDCFNTYFVNVIAEKSFQSWSQAHMLLLIASGLNRGPLDLDIISYCFTFIQYSNNMYS